MGNACDADLNNDGFVDESDLEMMKAAFYVSDPNADADLNGDGIVEQLDLGLMSILMYRPTGPSCCRTRTVITEVVVTDDGRSNYPGYNPLERHIITHPDRYTGRADINSGIGGETVSIWVKYAEVAEQSSTPVLTGISVEHWPGWNGGPYSGGAYCPPDWQAAAGNPAGNSPSGALTTGTINACRRMGLCIRMEPMNEAIEPREEAPPLTSLSLSWTGDDDGTSCPELADLGTVIGSRSHWTANDIHQGCDDDTWVRICEYAERGYEAPQLETFITDVRVERYATKTLPGYTPLSFHRSALPGSHTESSNVNEGIGDSQDSVSIWAKFEEVDPTSSTPVLTDLAVEHWPDWNGTYSGGAYCAAGWQPAAGNDPSGALTTGTVDACWRQGLCIKLEPVNQLTSDPDRFPIDTLGLSAGTEPWDPSCPTESDVRGGQVPRAFTSNDIHQGCLDGSWFRVCAYADRAPEPPEPEDPEDPVIRPVSPNLHALAEQYAPLWRFHPFSSFFVPILGLFFHDELNFPMDLASHLTEPVQVSEGPYSREYGVNRVCDGSVFRLEYDWWNPINGDDKTGREFGRSTSGKTYAFVTETSSGYDIHYFVFYVYNFGHFLLTEYDHWGDWERATVHLEWVGQELAPTGYTTEAHGNTWYNTWNGGGVWKHDLITDEQTDHPHALVADGSHGTYPHTNNERNIDNLPDASSYNRTCSEGHEFWPFCDFIDGDGESAILPVETIRVDGLFDPGPIEFVALDANGNDEPTQPEWLRTDFACGSTLGLEGPIYWWGNASHDGGPRTPLVKSNMPWSNLDDEFDVVGNSLALLRFGGNGWRPVNSFTLHVTSAPPGQVGLFLYGVRTTPTPFGDGLLCAGGTSGVYRLAPAGVVDANGAVSHQVDFDAGPVATGPGEILPGSTWSFQFWYRDPAANGSGFNLSDGLQAYFCN